ncbi:unnamed protein product, partial [Laminaria digitata]
AISCSAHVLNIPLLTLGPCRSLMSVLGDPAAVLAARLSPSPRLAVEDASLCRTVVLWEPPQSIPSSSFAWSLCGLATAFRATPQCFSHVVLPPQVSFLVAAAAACSPFGETFFSAHGISGGGGAISDARISVWTEGALLAAGAGIGEAGPCLAVSN